MPFFPPSGRIWPILGLTMQECGRQASVWSLYLIKRGNIVRAKMMFKIAILTDEEILDVGVRRNGTSKLKRQH